MKYKYLTMLMLGTCITATAQDAKPKEESKPAPAPEVKAEEAKPAEVKAKSVSEQIKEIIATAAKEQNEFMKKVRAEKDREKAMELYRTARPSMKPYQDKVFALVKKDPSSEEVVSGLAWLYGRGQGKASAEAIDLLLKHHKDSKALGSIVYSMGRSYNPDLDLVRKVMYASNNEKVRQTALYTLAKSYNRNTAKKAEALALFKQIVSWPGIETSNPRLLSHVKKELYVIENLAVGKVAPDIVGTDQDDKEFKLSDYKGKVVLLDFWGIW